MNKKLLLNIKNHKIPTENLAVKYIVRASIEVVENKEILFISLFNQNPWTPKPDFKIFICGKEYISQKLEKDGSYKWSEACLEYLIGYWHYSRNGKTGSLTQSERKKISKYFNIPCIKNGEEYKAINSYQIKIMQERLNNKHDKIKKKIDEVMDKVQELPKDFDKWIYDIPLNFSRYIYYKREGKKILGFCTECKKDIVIHETKRTSKMIKHNSDGTCPLCNKKIHYKAIGKSTRVYDRADASLIQKFEDGIIIRYFKASKSYMDHYKEPKVSYYESSREVYTFESNKLEIRKYEWYDFLQTGRVRWCNYSGKVSRNKGYLYTKNINTVVKDTKWKYSCMYDYVKHVPNLYPDNFLTEYIKYPVIEYLIKLKLYKLLSECIGHYWTYYSSINIGGKNIKEVLGVGKEEVLIMQRLNLGKRGMELLRMIAETGRKMTDGEIKYASTHFNVEKFKRILDHATPYKIIQYVKRQANDKYIPENVLIDWCDYIYQCKKLKYDLNNTFILYPKDLKERHEEYSMLVDEKKYEKYIEKVKEAYEKLNKVYSFEDKNFVIRPACSVKEIVAEGHKNRHCVGGVGYVRGMANGKIAIMLIRKKDDLEKPFYTLELNLSTNYVVQCRGYKNCDATEEVNKFLVKWKKSKLSIKPNKKAV